MKGFHSKNEKIPNDGNGRYYLNPKIRKKSFEIENFFANDSTVQADDRSGVPTFLQK